SISKAAEDLLTFGPKEILITHEEGISLFTNSESFNFSWKNKDSVGRTGRGDTAFISYLGSRITKSPPESLKFAAALTSLKMELPGPFALPLYQVTNLIKKEY
ncbi:MAG: PfkB family carbohydrate kinase, partial [Candidatus Kariarchaeaceae archaeon]